MAKSVSRRQFLKTLGVGVGGLAVGAAAGYAAVPTRIVTQTAKPGKFVLNVGIAEREAYWLSRYNLGAMTLMSGLGPRLIPPEGFPQKLAERLKFDLSVLPKNIYLLQAVYATGDPRFTQKADFKDLSKLYWDQAKMDKTFIPASQALTIIKVVAKQFRLDYHDYAPDKFRAIVQLQEAKSMARFMAERLTDGKGLLVAVSPDDKRAQPIPYDQIAGLWAYSALSLALVNPELPLFSSFLEGAAGEAAFFRGLADRAFRATRVLPAETVFDKALTVEAYGWYAAATNNKEARRTALKGIDSLASSLMRDRKVTLIDLAISVYGLGEASRLTGKDEYLKAAIQIFSEDIETLWDDGAGTYATAKGVTRYAYTPLEAGTVIAALNTIRWLSPAATTAAEDSAGPGLATRRWLRFFENTIVLSGMQLANAIWIVNPHYLKEQPREYFTPPSLKLSSESVEPYGQCPVYASQVVYENGIWTLTDRRFNSAQAMFLAIFSTWLHGTNPDGFIPLDLLWAKVASEADLI